MRGASRLAATCAAALAACFDANPRVGVPCDPGGAACPDGQACIASGGGFACQLDGTPPVLIDSPIAPATPFCDPEDPALLLCFDFDAAPLASPIANQGRVPTSATVANVSRVADRKEGGAAKLAATSSITVPADPAFAGILVVEASVRFDAAIPDGMRAGVIDAESDLVQGFSVFVYGGAVGAHQLRCNVGAPDLFVDISLVPGTWIDLKCTCIGGVVAAFVDGVKLGEAPGCTPAGSPDFSMQIGQNNNVRQGNPPNEPLIGAIDDVRVRTAP